MRTPILAMAVIGCTTTGGDLERLEPTFIEVSGTTAGGATGSLEYSNEIRTMSVSGQNLDRNAGPMPTTAGSKST